MSQSHAEELRGEVLLTPDAMTEAAVRNSSTTALAHGLLVQNRVCFRCLQRRRSAFFQDYWGAHSCGWRHQQQSSSRRSSWLRRMNGGTLYCELCWKRAAEERLTSRKHLDNFEWDKFKLQAGTNVAVGMAGVGQSFRSSVVGGDSHIDEVHQSMLLLLNPFQPCTNACAGRLRFLRAMVIQCITRGTHWEWDPLPQVSV